jgi:hypothetical protein
MTFEALLLDVYLDDVQDAAEAVRIWHAERILAESAEIEASAPAEPDDDDVAYLMDRLDARDPAA